MICCKPVGVLSEDSESGRCMPQLLREHYLAQGQKNPYIATVHRLDKITGGVMVFSRRREVTGKLTAAMQAHELVKEYLAVLRGHPQESAATLTDLLFRDAGRNKSYVVKRMRKGVREARLSYEELGRTEELSLVRNMMTGEMIRILDGPFGIADVTIENILCGRDHTVINENIRRIQAMTPADVQLLARKYLSREELVTVIAGDLRK